MHFPFVYWKSRTLQFLNITCSFPGGAAQTTFVILCAYNVSWLWYVCSFTSTVPQPNIFCICIVNLYWLTCSHWSCSWFVITTYIHNYLSPFLLSFQEGYRPVFLSELIPGSRRANSALNVRGLLLENWPQRLKVITSDIGLWCVRQLW
jgi:hypothetical protein